MSTKNQVIARLTVDRRYSGDIIDQMRKHYPAFKHYANKEPRSLEEIVDFTIHDAACGMFFDRYRGLGPNRGRLDLYRALPLHANAPA